MKKAMVKTEDLTLYFDGTKCHFGKLTEDLTFVDIKGAFGQHLKKSQINTQIKLGGEGKAIVLKDLIEQETISLKTINLDEMEVEFLAKIYGVKETKQDLLFWWESILSKKVGSRLRHKESTEEMETELKKLEDEMSNIM